MSAPDSTDPAPDGGEQEEQTTPDAPDAPEADAAGDTPAAEEPPEEAAEASAEEPPEDLPPLPPHLPGAIEAMLLAAEGPMSNAELGEVIGQVDEVPIAPAWIASLMASSSRHTAVHRTAHRASGPPGLRSS